jgi:hypothetical protein
MDSATKVVLLNLLKNLKQSTEDSSHSQEMAWRTFTGLSRMFPDQFPAEYQAAQGVSAQMVIC